MVIGGNGCLVFYLMFNIRNVVVRLNFFKGVIRKYMYLIYLFEEKWFGVVMLFFIKVILNIDGN